MTFTIQIPISLQLLLQIIKELFLITLSLFKYTWLILYYIYCVCKYIREFFENPYDDYHFIKVTLAGIFVGYCTIKSISYIKNNKINKDIEKVKKITC